MTSKDIAYQARTYPHRDIEGMINELINEKLCAAERSEGIMSTLRTMRSVRI
jgi:hypothetical protein